MRKLAAAIAILPAVAPAADAFDSYVADVRFLQNDAVRKELNITPAQRTRMNASADRHRKTLESYDKQLAAGKRDEAAIKALQPKLASAFTTLKKEVLAQLTPTQLRRLREITMQAAGLGALTDERIAARIGLKGKALTDYRALFRKGIEERNKMVEAGLKRAQAPYVGKKPKDQAEADKWRADIQKRMQAEETKMLPALQKKDAETAAQLERFLTPPMRASLKTLQGKPFRPA
jgi:tryptophan 2,3-dioxygenase